MVSKRGFTVVELVVVMVVMAILLTLGVLNLTASQVSARNAERVADIETIAKGLEARYLKGSPAAVASFIKQGSYPSISEIQSAEGLSPDTAVSLAAGVSGVYIDQVLPGTSIANFIPPNASPTATVAASFKIICPAASCASVAAEDSARINAALPANVTNIYVYEPITADNKICQNTLCVRYNLYYYLEGNSTLQTETSRHQ